jgi:hypothetical protein
MQSEAVSAGHLPVRDLGPGPSGAPISDLRGAVEDDPDVRPAGGLVVDGLDG